MPSPRTRMLLIGLAVTAACQEFDPPPVNPTPRLDYPSGVVADFPHLNPGDTVIVMVKVTSGNGKPAQGVEVIWDDGFVSPSVLPARSMTDGGGIASGRWAVRPLLAGVFSQRQWVRALVPGAENSPLEFRATVILCTRC